MSRSSPLSERILPTPPSSGVITIGERRIANVVVVLGSSGGRSSAAAVERIRNAANPFGAVVESSPGGAIVATLAGRGSARDQARQAARCALAMRDVVEDRPLALLTRSADEESADLEEVVESAYEMLRGSPSVAPGSGRLRPVAVEAAIARLLDGQFDIVAAGSRLGLKRERSGVSEGARTFLGRPTDFIGREHEMVTLAEMFDSCAEDGISHAVVVTAASGVGKSRLCREFVTRVRVSHPEARVCFAQGDPMHAGSTLNMIAQLVRSLVEPAERATLRMRRAALVERLSRQLGEERGARAAEFLGELAGLRFPEAKSLQLQAARRDPVLMGDQMRRAWDELLLAECSERPVLLVLEDLHWGDLGTVSFIDGALRNLRDRPLMVLALGQPDLHRLFPRLWSEHPTSELRLRELSRKASERLVRQAFGTDRSEETVALTVERAAGNAFFLEELVRSVVEGREGAPSTVLAVVQGRLASLDASARRVLRAASVFGSSFWEGGVAGMLDPVDRVEVRAQLEELTRRELIVPSLPGRFEGEYVFRNAIVREAAYSMLTAPDRVLAHGLAGAWLEQAGETDATAIAEHFERASDPVRALEWYARAAAHALESNDMDAVITGVDHAVRCGPTEDQLGGLLVLKAKALVWSGEHDRVIDCVRRAMERAPTGGAVWYDAASELVCSSARAGRLGEEIGAVVARLCEAAGADPSDSAAVRACSRAGVALVFAGMPGLAEKLFEPIDRAGVDPEDPSVMARVHQARASRAFAAGEYGLFLERSEAAALAFEQAGDDRNACLQRLNAGFAHTSLGAYEAAEATLRDALAAAGEMGLRRVVALARQSLGRTLARRGALQEARALEELSVEMLTSLGETPQVAWCRAYLAELFAFGRNHEAAERESRLALALAGNGVSELQAFVLATLARALLATKRVDEALAASQEGLRILERLGGSYAVEADVLLARAEALLAAGDELGATGVLVEARRRLLSRAARIKCVDQRRSFLRNVSSHGRTLELAEQWLGPPSSRSA